MPTPLRRGASWEGLRPGLAIRGTKVNDPKPERNRILLQKTRKDGERVVLPAPFGPTNPIT